MIVAPVERRLAQFDDLRGEIVATPPRLSAVFQLVEQELERQRLVGPDGVKLELFRTKTACMHAVASGTAAACALPGFALAQLKSFEPIAMEPKFGTDSIPGIVLIGHSRLGERTLGRLQETVLGWEVGSGRPARAREPRLERFHSGASRRVRRRTASAEGRYLMRHGLSLHWRIVLVIFALQLVLSAALLFFTLRQHLTSQEALWQRNDQNFVTLLSDIGRVALLTDDYTELQTFIAETASSGEFDDIVLVDLAGRVVAAKDQADLGSRLDPGPVIAGPDRWVVEVSTGEHRLGTLVVAVSDAALHASFGDAYRRGALVAGIGIVLMAVSAFWFGHLLTHRLQRLAETADRITDGDSEARATIQAATRSRASVVP